jgi:hypothetical protein
VQLGVAGRVVGVEHSGAGGSSAGRGGSGRAGCRASRRGEASWRGGGDEEVRVTLSIS